MPTPNDTPNLPPGELGEPIDGEPMIDKHTGKKILRPRNAWILYRNSRLDDVPSLPDGSRQPMADASKIISSWWKSESTDVKYKYELEAEREKEEHKRKYPNYRFQPMSKAQKAQKKAESREKVKQAQLVKRKAKTQKSSQPQPYATSAHTSYLAAAVANYAQQATRPLAVPAYAAEGPSPPMSQASTPTTTPSPFPSSDFEQGSSTSATSAHTMPSPSDALGLGLPSMLNFGGQAEASARVPRRAPARLPPRPKGPKIKLETSVHSRVPSSSSTTARALSPATGTSAALSPLPWPLPSNDTHQQQPPHHQAESPAPSIDSSVVEAPQPWYTTQIFDSTPDESTTVDLDVTIPNSFSDEFFSNLAAGGAVMPQGTGIFSMPMDAWSGQPPDQFDVSLGSSDNTTPLTPEDEQRFNTFLYGLLSPGDDSIQDPSSSAMAPGPPTVLLPDATADHDEWRNWVSESETSQGEIPSSAALTNGSNLPVFDHADVNMSMVQGPTPPADYYEPPPNLHDEQSKLLQQPTPPPSQQHIDDSLPAHLAADPTFLHFYGQYLAHKQSTEQQRHSRQPQQTYPSHPQQQRLESQQYIPQEQLQYGSPVSSQPASRQPSYVIHSDQSSVVVPLSPAPSGDSFDGSHHEPYTPPSGAATTVGLRRVAAMWQRPPVQAPIGAPQWNSVSSN